MRLSTTAATILAFAAHASSWTLGTPKQQFDGNDNFGCTAITVEKGEKIDWDVGVLSSCTLRIYDDANCYVQIGISSWDCDKVLTRTMRAFDVQDCGDWPV